MDGERRKQGLPLRVYRDFAKSRLEPQVMAQVYELIVPVVRRAVAQDHTIGKRNDDGAHEVRSRRFAQGA